MLKEQGLTYEEITLNKDFSYLSMVN
ncbi:hypothetical protein [Rivularia sp. PCC 7116]|nr:hypothetical protein [Rivularia sp. PCC 7116]